MSKFTWDDFRRFEKSPTSAMEIHDGISNLIVSSADSKVRVESIDHQTGEYRILLYGTLDMREGISPNSRG